MVVLILMLAITLLLQHVTMALAYTLDVLIRLRSITTPMQVVTMAHVYILAFLVVWMRQPATMMRVQL
jgi:hypothetical protein